MNPIKMLIIYEYAQLVEDLKQAGQKYWLQIYVTN